MLPPSRWEPRFFATRLNPEPLARRERRPRFGEAESVGHGESRMEIFVCPQGGAAAAKLERRSRHKQKSSIQMAAGLARMRLFWEVPT